MKTKENHWDISKKQFYENLKKRKDEITEELAAAAEARDYCEFDDFEKANYEYRFLKDMLGPVVTCPQGQWDYCDLIHLPKFKWTDSEGTEHIHTFIGTHTPAYYGFLAVGNLYSSDNSIDIAIVEPNGECGHEDERKIDIKVNPEYVGGGKVKDVTVNGKSVLDESTGIAAVLAQTPVIYQEDEPEEANDGDLWAFKSDEEAISYNDLSNKPEINGKTLQGEVTLSELDLYSKTEVDEKIAAGGGTYRGEYDAGTIAPEWSTYDYDTFIKSKITDPANKDWVYVGWTESKAFDRCAYDATSGKWEFQIRIASEVFEAKYIELYGAKGNLTDEQLAILNASVVNYIWLANDTTSTDGMVFHCVYYKPTVSATYEAVKEDTNYTISIDLDAKQYTVMTTQFAKKDEIVTPVQSDWNETDESSLAYIKNKPTISGNHLYVHILRLGSDVGSALFNIINNKSTDYTLEELATYIINYGYKESLTSRNRYNYPANTVSTESGSNYHFTCHVYDDIPNTIYMYSGTSLTTKEYKLTSILYQKTTQIF